MPQPALRTQTATIAINTAVSDVKNLTSCVLVGIILPAAWTAADLAFLVSHDNVTYVPLYDVNDVQVSAKAAASRQIALEPATFASVRYLKLQSGLTGATVNQAAERVLTLITRSVE